MKKIILALLFATVGMLSISSCKEKENVVSNPLIGTWICIDERYTEMGVLQLLFNDNKTVLGINSTGQPSVFDDLDATYEYKDNFLYLDGIKAYYITFLSENEINILFLGLIEQIGATPNVEYNFSRVGGAK